MPSFKAEVLAKSVPNLTTLAAVGYVLTSSKTTTSSEPPAQKTSKKPSTPSKATGVCST